MSIPIVADGWFRWLATGENARLRRAVWLAVEARYARRLERAGFFQWLRLRYLRYRRFRRELARITPSAQSLWLGQCSAKVTTPIDHITKSCKPWFPT
jgi:hypothetical protein